jgi:hypothetical protein
MQNKGIEKATGSATTRLGGREVQELAYAAFISDREKSNRRNLYEPLRVMFLYFQELTLLIQLLETTN